MAFSFLQCMSWKSAACSLLLVMWASVPGLSNAQNIFACTGSTFEVYRDQEALRRAEQKRKERPPAEKNDILPKPDETEDPMPQQGAQQTTGTGLPEEGKETPTLGHRVQRIDEAEFQYRILPDGNIAQLTVFRPYDDVDTDTQFFGHILKKNDEGGYQGHRTLNVLGVEPGENNRSIVVTFDLAVQADNWWWSQERFLFIACKDGDAEPVVLVNKQAWVSRWRGAGLLTAILILFFYSLVVRFHGGDRKSWNPIRLTAGVTGRASLSKLQIYGYTLVVAAIVSYVLLRTGVLVDLSEDVLWLLGIAGAGTSAAKLTSVNRQRLSLENWAWLTNKGWVKTTSYEASARDLFTSDDKFDVYKFQMMIFSLIVAIALLTAGFGGLAEFQIPDGFLGLLGLSQTLYVGGKLVATPTIEDLEKQVKELRKLERAFVNALAGDERWKELAEGDRTVSRGAEIAPDKYDEYMQAACETATAVEKTPVLSGGVRPSVLDPALPGECIPVSR